MLVRIPSRPRAAALATLATVATLGLGASGCIAAGARINAGAVAAGDKAGMLSSIEYYRLPDPDADVKIMLRGGIGGQVALAGDPFLSSGELGAMVVLRDRGSSWEGHEKMGGGGWSR